MKVCPLLNSFINLFHQQCIQTMIISVVTCENVGDNSLLSVSNLFSSFSSSNPSLSSLSSYSLLPSSISLMPLMKRSHHKRLTVGQKLLVHAKIMKMVQEKKASLQKAWHHFNIDKSQYCYCSLKVEQWLESMRRSCFESKTPISGSKTKTVKTKKNSSHHVHNEDSLLWCIFVSRGTSLPITIQTILLQACKLKRCIMCKDVQAKATKSVKCKKMYFSTLDDCFFWFLSLYKSRYAQSKDSQGDMDGANGWELILHKPIPKKQEKKHLLSCTKSRIC